LFYCSQNVNLFWFSNLSILSVPDEGYSRNASCAIKLISTFVLFVTTIGQMILWGTNSPPAEVSTGDSNTNVDIKFSVLNKGLNEYFLLYQGYNHVPWGIYSDASAKMEKPDNEDIIIQIEETLHLFL
jgi:hypothetical protein